MPEIIIRPSRSYPVFGGVLPSQNGGRRSLILASVSQDGKWNAETEDLGPENACDQPILFVPFMGVDYALTKGDLKEMLAGMRERHQKWRDERPPPPDFTKALKEFCEIILSRARGRQQFYFREGIHGK